MFSSSKKDLNPGESFSSRPGRPFEKDEVEDYEQKRYRGIDQRIVHRQEARILQKILKAITEEKRCGSRSPEIPFLVLDLPCGYGRFSNLLLDSGLKLASSDLSFYMVKRTRDKLPFPKKTLGVVADAKQGLPFKNGIFDGVFSIRFFHHLREQKEREAILKEFSRVSAQWVVLSFYKMNALHALQRKIRRLVKKSKTQVMMVPLREFLREAREAGFEVLKIHPLLRGIHAYHLALLKKR